MTKVYACRECPEDVLSQVETPCYLISKDIIRNNCSLLDTVQQRTGARILLALKAFALPALFPVIAEKLHGICASGPIEAQLGREYFNREVHTYSPAYSDRQMQRVIKYSDHIVFNSITQLNKHLPSLLKSSKDFEIGLRVNPGHSEVGTDLYNPCLPGSRFGIQPEDLQHVDFDRIDGLHFHAMCEQDADVLERILAHFEDRFKKYIPKVKWVNFGGGHHITKDGYKIDLLCDIINRFKEKYRVDVYLEPGEAVVLNGGFLATTVLDIVHNGMDIAILDTSAETHMPDVLAMPYRPVLPGSGQPGEYPYTYRLGGISCLAGDIIGDYSFKSPLTVGDMLIFNDMALYSFVKNTTFNGVELPALYGYSLIENQVRLIRKFGFDDYRCRIA